MKVDEDYFDEQDLRVIKILAPEQLSNLDDVPSVNNDFLALYFEYLNERLLPGLLLTGTDTTGYFSWEEPFEWQENKGAVYDKLRKGKGSFREKYTLQSLFQSEISRFIIAIVLRENDNKMFEIDLEDLKLCSENHIEYELIEDYSYWVVNYF